MSRNRMAEARHALNRIAKMNKVSLCFSSLCNNFVLKSTVPVDEMVDEMLLDEANESELNKGNPFLYQFWVASCYFEVLFICGTFNSY